MKRRKDLYPDSSDLGRRRPSPKNFPQSDDLLSMLSRRIEITYLCRVEMAQRLERRGKYWNSAIISLTVSSLIISICLLRENSVYGKNGDVFLVVIGAITLISSLMVVNSQYLERSKKSFENYRRLQRLSTQVHSSSIEKAKHRKLANRLYESFDRRYQDLLDVSDNHSAADYLKTLRLINNREAAKGRIPLDGKARYTTSAKDNLRLLVSGFVTLIPGIIAVLSFLSLTPVVIWMIND